jgi:hypothetical protein
MVQGLEVAINAIEGQSVQGEPFLPESTEESINRILSQNDALMGRSQEIIQLLKKDDDVQPNPWIEPNTVKIIDRMNLDLSILNACWIPVRQI